MVVKNHLHSSSDAQRFVSGTVTLFLSVSKIKYQILVARKVPSEQAYFFKSSHPS
jgi:hypothetical protein